MKKKFSFLFLATIFMLCQTINAKIWRVNNNAGVNKDFADLNIAVASVLVLNGDTIHVEPSSTTYTFPIVNKQLVIIGNSYLLSGVTGNSGLQANTLTSKVNGLTFANGCAGTKIMGMDLTSVSDFQAGFTNPLNIVFEKCQFTGGMLSFTGGSTFSNITIRKCYFTNTGVNQSPGTLNNFIMENCIWDFVNIIYLTPTNGTGITIRNNVFKTGGGDLRFNNAYFANNIILNGGTINTFLNCNIKNNLFTSAQTGVTIGPLSVNGNNLVSQSEASIISGTGSNDAKYQLKTGSPGIIGGVDISGFKPDCGAFGGNDPYRLSGIPAIPTIYSLSVPASIPVGTPSMNVTFSTRNNN